MKTSDLCDVEKTNQKTAETYIIKGFFLKLVLPVNTSHS